MRTAGTAIAAALLLASSASVVVFAHQTQQRGGSELLIARRAEAGKAEGRRAIAEGMFDVFMDKRGEAWGREANGPDDCGDDEEWVPYQQNNVVDKPKEEKPKQEEEKVQTPTATVTAIAAVSTSGLTTPDDIPEGTYTVEEGCTLYHHVSAGEICLGLLDIAHQQGFGTTLEELYCLNPQIDDLCYNLQIDQSYCIAYSNATVTLPTRR